MIFLERKPARRSYSFVILLWSLMPIAISSNLFLAVNSKPRIIADLSLVATNDISILKYSFIPDQLPRVSMWIICSKSFESATSLRPWSKKPKCFKFSAIIFYLISPTIYNDLSWYKWLIILQYLAYNQNKC